MEFALKGLRDKLTYMLDNISELPMGACKDIMSKVIELESTLDKYLHPNNFDHSDPFAELAKNNIKFEEFSDEESVQPIGFNTPNKVILNKYLNNNKNDEIKVQVTPQPNINIIDDSRNPIYNPLNYYNKGDSTEVIKYKIKKGLKMTEGFFNEPLSKTQRKKRNQILNAFLNNL